MLNEMRDAEMMVIDGGGSSQPDGGRGGNMGGAAGVVRDIGIYVAGATTANLTDDAINYCKAAVISALTEGRPPTTNSSQILRNSWW